MRWRAYPRCASPRARRRSRFKGTEVDIKDIARKLRVGYLLEGSVRQSGTRLRVTAQLSSAADGFQMWSERYDREIADVFEILDEIAERIAASLQVALFDASGERVSMPVRRGSMDIETYELYLKGRHYRDQRVDGMRKAVEYYQRAIDRDPTFALALAAVAEGHFLLTMYNAMPPHEGAPKARMAALRALAIDPSLAEALIVLSGASLWYDWDHAETLRLIGRALHLKPSDPLAHCCHAYYLASLGRHEDAVERATHAAELDPLGALTLGNLAVMHYLASRFADTVSNCDTILEISPNNSEAHRWRALSQFHMAQLEPAFRSIDAAVEQSQRHPWPLANQAAMAARAGRTHLARAILHELEERSAHEFIPPLALATVYYGLGELDTFFGYLDRSIDARDAWLVMLPVDPDFAALREDPRFQAALSRIVPRI